MLWLTIPTPSPALPARHCGRSRPCCHTRTCPAVPPLAEIWHLGYLDARLGAVEIMKMKILYFIIRAFFSKQGTGSFRNALRCPNCQYYTRGNFGVNQPPDLVFKRMFLFGKQVVYALKPTLGLCHCASDPAEMEEPPHASMCYRRWGTSVRSPSTHRHPHPRRPRRPRRPPHRRFHRRHRLARRRGSRPRRHQRCCYRKGRRRL